MADIVEFFTEDVTCLNCKQHTRGLVYEHSGQIICTECEEPIFDAADVDGGTLVILQLDDGVIH